MKKNESNQQAAPVSQDLLDKVQATKAIVTIHSLLGVGMFQYRHNDQVKQSLDFLGNLHKQVLDDALSHPDADKVKDLVDYKAEKEAQEKLQELIKSQSEGQE